MITNVQTYTRGQPRQWAGLREGPLTKSGHPIASFVEQLECDHEEGVRSAEHRLKSTELLKRDQPDRETAKITEREREF